MLCPSDRPVVTCCARCRLIQPRGDACTHCGEPLPFSLEAADEFLAEPAAGLSGALLWEAWVFYGALLVSGAGVIAAVLGYPRMALTLFGVMVAGALIAGVRRKRWSPRSRKARMRAVAWPRPEEQPAAQRYRGRARRAGLGVKAQLSSEEVLASHLLITDSKQQLYFRSLRSADFVLVTDSGEMLAIQGPLWLECSTPSARRGENSTPGVLSRLRLSSPFLVEGAPEEHLLRDGDPIEVSGVCQTELGTGLTHLDLSAGYRNHPVVRVIRGTRGRAVLVRARE